MKPFLLFLFIVSIHCSFAQRDSIPTDFMLGKWSMNFGPKYFSIADDGVRTDTLDGDNEWAYDFLKDGTFLDRQDSIHKGLGKWSLKNNVLILSAFGKEVMYEITRISGTRAELVYSVYYDVEKVDLYIHLTRITGRAK